MEEEDVSDRDVLEPLDLDLEEGGEDGDDDDHNIDDDSERVSQNSKLISRLFVAWLDCLVSKYWWRL